MTQISTDVKQYRIYLYEIEGKSTHVDVSEQEYNFVKEGITHHKATKENVPFDIRGVFFSVTNIKMMKKIKDNSKLNADYKHSNEILKKIEEERNNVSGIEETRKWAKSMGIDGKAIECTMCNKWSPYMIKPDEQGKPSADFECKHCDDTAANINPIYETKEFIEWFKKSWIGVMKEGKFATCEEAFRKHKADVI